MTFSITDTAARSAIEAARTTGNWSSFYAAVYDAITDVTTIWVPEVGDVTTIAPKEGVDPAVWAWVAGAKKVNENSGAFASYIRDYTARQYEIRNGEQASGIATRIQDASNDIAAGFAQHLIVANSWTLPDLHSIGQIDAAGPAARVFYDVSPDGVSNSSPWAGTVLFASLGDKSFFTGGTPPAGNAQDPWILTLGTNGGKKETGTYDLISVAQVTTELKSAGRFLHTIASGELPQYLLVESIGAAAKAAAIDATNQFFRNTYGQEAAPINIGKAIFDNLTGALSGPRSFLVGTVGDDTGNKAIVFNGETLVVNSGRGDDVLKFQAPVNSGLPGKAINVIDGGDGIDTLEYTPISAPLYVTIDNKGAFGWRAVVNVGSNTLPAAKHLDVNIEKLKLGSGADELRLGAGSFSAEAQAALAQLEIDMGGGNDTVFSAPVGTEITLGQGQDTVHLSHGMGIMDLGAEDRVTYGGTLELHGGHRYMWSESPWAISFDAVRWGTNQIGELLVNAGELGTLFILNWGASGGMDVPFEQRPGLISVHEYDMGVYRLLDPNMPTHMTQMGTWDLMGAIVQEHFGVKIWKRNDPLTLDLDGDGLELTPQTSLSPLFDMDGDLYAERTGWVGPDDGVLVRDLNGNDIVDDATELFGGARSGFEMLAELDGNQDGKVDANDDGLADFNDDGLIDVDDTFDSLKIWRDLNGDIVTDAGELFSLADLGIVSISVQNTPDGETLIADNLVASTATFTRSDSTTGTIADVWYRIDNVFTQYTGGPITISAEAEELPDHKGFGTLVSLREAMSLDPAFLDIVEDTLPLMSSLDLDVLRLQALPILTGWALASPLGDGDTDPNTSAPKLKGHNDVHVLVIDGPFGRDQVIDFAYETTATLLDENEQPYTVSYWALASGAVVKDENDEVIEHPTLQQVLDAPQPQGSWSTLSGDIIAFMERYLGESLPLDRIMPEGTEPITGFTELFTSVLATVDLAVVRIATQGGPLSSYFEGLEYDAESHNFRAADGNDRELIPVFEAIFTTAKNQSHDATWIGDWKPILDIVIGDFVRDEAYLLNTYGFLAQNIVAAYENTDLTLNFVDVAAALGLPEDLIVTGTGTLNGSQDGDIFYAGGGNETLQGGAGPDTYVFGQAIGHDVINDVEVAFQDEHVPDILRFAHLTPSDVTATRDGLDLVLTVNATGETIRVVRQFEGREPTLTGGDMSDETGIGEIVFADGTVWDLFDIAEAVRNPQPTSDTILGTPSIDFLDGGAGDDTLSGGNDGDRYYFDVGYGADTIQDTLTNVMVETPDMVLFGGGITEDNVIFGRDGNSGDLQISIDGASDTLTVAGQFDAYYTGPFGTQWFDRIELFVFSDQTYLTWQEIIEFVLVNGRTEGDDTIYGFSYEDVLDGGLGDDFLSGGNENDTYVFGVGYGHDTVYDTATNIIGGMTDTVLFNDDVLAEDVTFSRIGATNDLLVTLASGDTLTVRDQFHALDSGPFGVIWFERIERFEFSSTSEVLTYEDVMQRILTDGKTDGDDLIYGFTREDTIEGGLGNDDLRGGGWNDTYVYNRGDGNDTITEGPMAGDVDRLVLHGIYPSDVSLVRDGENVTLTIAPSTPGGADGGSILLVSNLEEWLNEGVEEIIFDDATVWTRSDLRLMLIAQSSTAGDDAVVGFGTNDTITGGLGNDDLHGMSGDDTYIYNRGDGNDTITDGAYPDDFDKLNLYGIDPSEVSLIRDENDVVLVIAPSIPEGTDGGSILLKESLNESFGQGIEQIIFDDGPIWARADLRTMLLAQDSTSGDDTIVGFNVDDVVEGGAGSDTLYGRDGNDILTGGTDDDLLIGGGGNDTYVFNLGDGQDVVREYMPSTSSGWGGLDTIQFGPGITAADLIVSQSNWQDLVLAIAGTSDQITIHQGITGGSDYRIEQVRFDDETVLTHAQLMAQILGGTPGDDVIVGDENDNVFSGGAGNDALNGRDGNDTLIGGTDDDLLTGGGGNDTYVFNLGDGQDVVQEYMPSTSSGWGGSDTIEFGPGISASGLIVSQANNGQDLVLAITGTSDQITIHQGIMGGSDYRVEQVRFDDSTVLTHAQLMVLATVPTSGDDIFYGDETVNVLEGGAGNDTLNSRDGNDALIGGTGDDVLTGGGGNDTYVFNLGDGQDVVHEYMPSTSSGWGGSDTIQFGPGITAADLIVSQANNGQDLVLAIAGTSDQITLHQSITGSSEYRIERARFDDETVLTHAQLMALATVPTSGDDVFYGDETANVLDGGAGNDTLNGRDGDDTLIGGDGNDLLAGGAGAETYVYTLGDGADTIDDQSTSAGDTLVLHDIDPDDVVVIRNGNNAILVVGPTEAGRITIVNQFTSSGQIEQVVFDDSTTWSEADILSRAITDSPYATHLGTEASETIQGSSNADVINGLGGDDILRGSSGADTYVFRVGSGNDTIIENSGSGDTDKIRLDGLNPADVQFGRSGNHLLIAIFATGATLTIQDHFQSTTSGIEEVVFADTTVWDRTAIAASAAFLGTDGNDVINGTSGNDTIIGGLGEDTLRGSAGADTYIYASGNGNDVLDDESGSLIDADVLKLVDLDPSDVQLTRSGVHLWIDIPPTGHRIIVDEHFWSMSANWGIEEIHFADETVWDRAYIAANAATRGTSGNDTLFGTGWNDLFVGGLGDDIFRSGSGSDTYIYVPGDGNDLIDEESGSTSEVDTLKFSDLNASDITLVRSGVHVVVNIGATGHQITLDEQYWSATANWGVDRFEFADSSFWTRDQIMQNAWWYGTSGNDTLSGWASFDNIDGGAGSDTINGNAGIDKIIGGVGDDTLTGGGGNDTFIFSSGFGQDTITDFTAGTGTDDVIEFQDGLFADFAAVQTASQQVGANVLITLDGSNAVTLQNVTLANLHQDDFHLV